MTTLFKIVDQPVNPASPCALSESDVECEKFISLYW